MASPAESTHERIVGTDNIDDDDNNDKNNDKNNKNAAITPEDVQESETTPPACTIVPDAPPFYYGMHTQYVQNLADQLEGTFEGALTNHLRLSGVYWSVCAMFLLCGDDLERVDERMGLLTPRNGKSSIVDWVDTCYDASTGAYGGDTGQEGHILYTLSALQVLAMANCLDRVHTDQVVQFIASLQQPDGSFVGDNAAAATATVGAIIGAEVDTRFSYCALSALSILGRLDAISVEKAVDYLQKCHNPLDGGYGSCIGAESHAGQVFCCIGALAIPRALPHEQRPQHHRRHPRRHPHCRHCPGG
jgi:geranylgeranyl transferase type-2 subunit beta